MVLIGSGLMVWVAITANTISAGEQQYFDRDDLYYAECVPVDQRKTYKYYGNESRFIVKGSTRERCAKWSDASFRLRTKVTDRWGTAKAWVYPEEYITHGQCRNFDFTLKDKRGVQHVIMHLKLHSGSYPGPWCYKEKGDLFVPMPCFGPCSKQTRVTPG
ncbi:hypothetical protein Tcan_16390 [Toxocara canis]|uniref:Kringle-like domain-containing protein n=1 Tax=Toxocara canis TaxID=6265 RepID=A0A0B2VI20_TOXCA|nr:hypothetical protein Tcan_16390 [Toxocara canis]